MQISFPRRLTLLTALCALPLTGAAFAQQPGAPAAPRTGAPRFTLEAGALALIGDLTNDGGPLEFHFLGGLEAGAVVSKHLALAVYGQTGEAVSTYSGSRSTTDYILYGGILEFRFPVGRGTVIPLLRGKLGGASMKPILQEPGHTASAGTIACFTYGPEAGIEFVSRRTIGIRVLTGVLFTTSDDWDVLTRGGDNDALWYGSLGLSWYLPRLFR